MTGLKVLLVEDEVSLASILADYLRREGCEVHCLQEGLAVLPWLAHHRVDVLLLDVMLPGMDGMRLVEHVRSFSQVPILLTTALAGEEDRLHGLQLGVDDYICKPYSPREVVARVAAVMRRFTNGHNPSRGDGWRLDASTLSARLRGHSVALTAVEFRLLQLMLTQPGRVFSRDELMRRIYDDGRVVLERTVDSHIKKLRRKLADCGDIDPIESVYGHGYRVLTTGRLVP